MLLTQVTFFAHSVLLKLNLKNQFKIAMHKLCSDKLTVSMVSGDFKEKVLEFIFTDQVFSIKVILKEPQITGNFFFKFL